MKDMTNVANTIMSEEEKSEVTEVAGANHASAPSSGASTSASASADHPPPNGPTQATEGATAGTETEKGASAGAGGATSQPSCSLVHHASSSDDAAGPSSAPVTPTSAPSPAAQPKKRTKLTPEQREKLAVHERERKHALEVRVQTLTKKLVERLRPFVEAKNPGGAGDSETAAWEARMRREADDLKLESFGVELLHAIGTVYVTKASSYLKSKKFLGM